MKAAYQNPQPGNNLLPADLSAFALLGISPEILDENQVCRVTDAVARDVYGIRYDAHADVGGILFPYLDPIDGHRTTCRVRRDHPEIDENGKPQNKYLTPWGDPRHLYVPRWAAALLKQPGVSRVLVESEKGALALCAWSRRNGVDIIPIAMGGCWGWSSQRASSRIADNGERVDVAGAIADVTNLCSGSPVYVLLDSNAATNLEVQRAKSALIRELRKPERHSTVLICELPTGANINGPDDFIAARGDEAMGQVFRDAHDNDRPAGFSEDALALRFTASYGKDLRYTELWKKWSYWDGTCWRKDDVLHAFDLARTLCRSIGTRIKDQRLAACIASAKTTYNVERLARSDERHVVTVNQWDADSRLLNTPGGVVDLRDGKLRAGRRRDYMTKITAVAPGGDCSRWLAFLDQITGKDKQLQEYLQRMCGYLLTGETREHKLFFCHGSGANGKSIFMGAVTGAMGDYARPAPIEMFLESRHERHPTDLAGLQGARLVTASETEKGRRWAEAKIKEWTGGEKITARFMYGNYFDYFPQFKLLLAGNHKPSLRTVDEAIRRRLVLIPFLVTILEAERDPKLAEKLRAEWGGILQWMIDGCVMWQARGLEAPETVKKATADYLAAEDALGRWIEERCAVEKNLWTSSKALYGDWRTWCEGNHEPIDSQKSFSQNLEARGFVPDHKEKGNRFLGIGLLPTTECKAEGSEAPSVTSTPTRARDDSETEKCNRASERENPSDPSASFSGGPRPNGSYTKTRTETQSHESHASSDDRATTSGSAQTGKWGVKPAKPDDDGGWM